MEMVRNSIVVLVAGITLFVAGCSSTPKVADLTGSLSNSLIQAGLKDVSVSQDRDKGVVTLGGHVGIDTDKVQAESIARSVAPGQVIANQIAILPAGLETAAKDITELPRRDNPTAPRPQTEP